MILDQFERSTLLKLAALFNDCQYETGGEFLISSMKVYEHEDTSQQIGESQGRTPYGQITIVPEDATKGHVDIVYFPASIQRGVKIQIQSSAGRCIADKFIGATRVHKLFSDLEFTISELSAVAPSTESLSVD